MATYSYTGSDVWTHGSIFATGSINIATNLPSIGSYSIQNISGIITVDNRVAGSIVNMPIVGVSGTVFNTVWLGTGSVVLSGTSIPVSRGIGSVRIAEQGVTLGVSGIVNQGTNPWTISGTTNVLNRVGGSIVDWPGSLAISNFNALGSSVIVTNFGTIGSGVVIKNELTLLSKAIDISSGTSKEIVASSAGNKINVYAYKLVCGSTLSAQFKNGGSAFEGFQFYDQYGGAVENVSPPNFLFQTYTGSALNIGTTGSIGGRVSYFLI